MPPGVRLGPYDQDSASRSGKVLTTRLKRSEIAGGRDSMPAFARGAPVVGCHGAMHASASPSQPPRVAFGAFVLDSTNRRLYRDGQPVTITARVFDILETLVRHAGRPVGKDALLEEVWGNVAVEEGNLTRNVSTLRKVLGETPDDHRFIVTLPGRGYQFVAAVAGGLGAGTAGGRLGRA